MLDFNSDALQPYAKKYVWWKTQEEAIATPTQIIAQVMNIGDYADIQALVKLVGEDTLREILRTAEIGQFSERSWTYWHYRLGLSPREHVPPMPTRKLE